MGNFGLDRLILSNPLTQDVQAAGKLAVHADHVLAGLRTVPDLRTAVKGCVFACGTTFRAEVGGRRALTPEAAIELLLTRASEGEVALVLGGERRGLSDEELVECDAFLTIPTDPRTPSMNLAQATTVLLYLVSRAARPESIEPAPPPAARLETVHALEGAMRRALEKSGFLNPQAPDYVLQELLHTLRRGRPTQREVELWTAAFKQLARDR